MKRRAFLLAAASCGCRGADQPRLDLAHGALSVARVATRLTQTEEDWTINELARIAERAHQGFAAGTSAAATLSKLLFQELGFVREVTSTDLDFVLLPSVLRRRRGNCVGLGTVYLALAEALGFDAHGVLRPGHFFVHQAGPGRPQNVELLRQGEAMSDSWYAKRFPVASGQGRCYGRELASSEALGVIAYDIGNERRRQQRLVEAERAYTRATQLFPDFAEAHASLGATRHVLGKYQAAAASYQIARRLSPDLSGLDANIALLQADMPR